MNLTSNIERIKERFPHLVSLLKEQGTHNPQSNITIETAKSGVPTISVIEGNNKLYIHSKYNPLEEARRLITQYGDLTKKHVVFYGIGLGYHVDLFVELFPAATFSVFEPSADIFYQSLNSRTPDFLTSHQLIDYQASTSKETISLFLNNVNKKMDDGLVLISLPSYEKTFPDEVSEFTQLFSRLLQVKKSNLFTNLKYANRWMQNSIVNFTDLLKTPNIFHDIDRSYFRNKPALIVAAGPSLNDEIENIRTIKEQGSAYIFAVGSSVNTLINNNIYPYAACTYDPQAITQITYKQIREKGITTIPLIYGSTVGYETVATYPGPKAHMITDQDTLAATLLKRTDESGIDIVQDAPSIAVVAFQLLAKLECNPIILVGQNLGYRGEYRYAAGISYMSQKVREQDLQNATYVEDVYGNQILSNQSFELMRKALEEYIALSNIQVINTTKGGAKIAGTSFIPFNEVLDTLLKERNIIDELNFDKNQSGYDLQYMRTQLQHIHLEYSSFLSLFDNFAKSLDKLKRLTDYREINKLSSSLTKVEQLFYEILNNQFYRVFLLLMNRVRIEWMIKQVEQLRSYPDIIQKANQVFVELKKFYSKTKEDLEQINPHYQKMIQQVMQFNDINVVETLS